MRKLILGLTTVGLIVCTATLSLAETAADRAACTPDVFRFCSSEIPNVPGIKACLRRQRKSLSTACKEVFKTLDRAEITPAVVTREPRTS